MTRRAHYAVVASLALAAFACATNVSSALPPPEAPEGRPAPSPTPPPPSASVLPFGSTLQLVIDDRVSSGTSPAGAVIPLHLKDALVLSGVMVAPAGTKTTMTIVSVRKAESGDQDGAVQIHLNPLPLANGSTLPIRAFHEFLTFERSAGRVTTRDTTDTIADIFIPYHIFYHAFRKGQELVLPPGSVMNVETAATLDARNAAKIQIATPPPFVVNDDPPHSDLTPSPLYTPPPPAPPRHPSKPRSTVAPTEAPSAAPTAVPTAAPSSASPSPAPSAS